MFFLSLRRFSLILQFKELVASQAHRIFFAKQSDNSRYYHESLINRRAGLSHVKDNFKMRTRSNREYDLVPEPTFSTVKSGRIGKRWPKKRPAGPISRANARPKGLENPGCLCYRRAVLQCLLHTPVFYNYLCRLDGCEGKAAEECVLCAFRDFAVQYWTSTDTAERYAANNRLDAALRRHPSRFEGVPIPDFVSEEDQQHDAHEFLMGLLLMLEDVDGRCLDHQGKL